ncbi:GntR family transcriptional regulator [soil metagenome]
MSTENSAVLPEQLAQQLRASILKQIEAPGSTITEAAVALRFGVARPTARQAIDRLVADGILRREAHHAARVPELSRDDIVDLFDNRAVIESAAIAALRSIPEDALDAHRSILAESDVADGDFAEADIAFHRALVAAQPSPRLTRMHALLMGEIELCIGQVQVGQLLTASEVAAQHRVILDATTAVEPERAAQLTRDHIRGSRDALLDRTN